MTKYKKGDKVRFIGNQRDFNDSVTTGKVYEINAVDDVYDASFYDDRNSKDEYSFISARTAHLFELVTEESPITESDLIANLALRVSELERAEIRSMHEAEASAYAKYGNPYDEQTEHNGTTTDNVNHPSHYTQGGVEVIDIIAQITRGYTDGFHAYCVGNALKYLARAPHKHATIDEDVRKAAKYLEFITDDKGAE